MKVWLLTNSPSPYQVEFFRELHNAPDLAFDVRFMQGEHRGLNPLESGDPGFPYRVLRARGRSSRPPERRFHPEAVREVCRGEHDFYILSGHYTSATFLLCALCLWLRRRRWAVWLERPWPDDYRPRWATKLSAKSGWVRWIRRRALACLLRMTDGVFGIGSVAVDAYRRLGARPGRLFNLPYLCDIERFADVPEAAVARVRDRYDLAGRTVFLFSGAITVRKGVDTLLDAFARLAAEQERVALLILGTGDQRQVLAARLEPATRARVHFAGHVPQEDLPAHFAAANVFVFPSRYDGWGVVINEACGAGLPIVTTHRTGAATDLVTDGYNGFVLDQNDRDGFYRKMAYLAAHPERARALGQAARSTIAAYDLAGGVQRFRAAIAACLSKNQSE